MADYLRQKRVAESSDDPVQDLRRGLDYHVAFGLANSAAYLLMFGDSSNFADTPGKREGEAILLALVARAAQAGRLAVAVPPAALMVSAACRAWCCHSSPLHHLNGTRDCRKLRAVL